MKRRLSLSLVMMLAGGTLAILAPAQPAQAWMVCAGGGTAIVTPGLKVSAGVNLPTTPFNFTPLPLPTQLEILIGKPNVIHGFIFLFGLGACTHGGATFFGLGATGTLKGYCDHASGTGTTFLGQLFAYISSGTVLVLTGHIVGIGTVTANPDATTGSCIHFHNPSNHAWSLNWGATSFLVEGFAVGLNCSGLEPLLPGTPQDFEFLQRVVDTDVLLPFPPVHMRVNYGIHFYWNHICLGNPILL